MQFTILEDLPYLTITVCVYLISWSLLRSREKDLQRNSEYALFDQYDQAFAHKSLPWGS